MHEYLLLLIKGFLMNKKKLIALILLPIGIGLIIFSLIPEKNDKNPGKIAGLQVANSPTPTPSPVINTPRPLAFIQTPSPFPSPSSNNSSSDQQTATNPPETPTPTSTPVPTVTLQIVDPDGTSIFSVTLHNGDNACDNLTEAKQEEKIKSVTLDYSYMSSMHSAYVKEINGFNKNWTFTVNGQSPLGCSLYKPNSGDTIIWKFG